MARRTVARDTPAVRVGPFAARRTGWARTAPRCAWARPVHPRRSCPFPRGPAVVIPTTATAPRRGAHPARSTDPTSWRNDPHGHQSPSTTRPGCTPAPTPPPSTRSTSTSRTASSSSSSARPAAASRPRCACSPGSRRSTAARIRIGDRDVTHMPPKDRDIAMVFQNYALYPHMSVADNMGFALKIAGIAKDEIAQARRGGREDARPRASTSTASRRRCPAASASASPWAARSCAQPAGLPDGRAAVQPRRQAPRADPHPDRRAAAPPRRSPPSTSPTTRSRP